MPLVSSVVVTPQSRVALRRRHDATVGLVTPFPKRVGAQLAVDGTPPAEPSGFALAYARAAESAGARSKQPSAAYVVGGWNVNLLVELRGAPSNFGRRIRGLAERLPALLTVEVEPALPAGPGQQQRRLSSERAAELVSDYQAGASIKSLVRKYGVHNMTVKAHLLRAGIVVDSWTRIDPALQAEIVRLYLNGKTMAGVAQLVGVSEPTVARVLRVQGVPSRLRGRRNYG